MSGIPDEVRLYSFLEWPVVPLHWVVAGGCSCPNPDCESQGKHPLTRRGLHDASADLEIIEAWWKKWPKANVGLRTGVGFDAWDIDDAGQLPAEALHYLADGQGPIVVTQSGGMHVYVRPTGSGNRGKGDGFMAGCDYRGANGLVVAPPSRGMDGEWTWLDGYGPTVPIPEAPSWLLDALAPKPRPTPNLARVQDFKGRPGRTLQGLVRTVLCAENGRRNTALNWAAYRAGEHVSNGHLVRTEAEAALVAAGLHIGLHEREVTATVSSGLRGGGA